MSFDTRSNTLLVADTARKVEAIRDLVAVLDRPVDQVLIEARIVIAQESFAREIGARFGISGQEGDVITSGNIESNRNYLNSLRRNEAAVATWEREGGGTTGAVTVVPPAEPRSSSTKNCR